MRLQYFTYWQIYWKFTYKCFDERDSACIGFEFEIRRIFDIVQVLMHIWITKLDGTMLTFHYLLLVSKTLKMHIKLHISSQLALLRHCSKENVSHTCKTGRVVSNKCMVYLPILNSFLFRTDLVIVLKQNSYYFRK